MENINAVLIDDGIPQGEHLKNSTGLPFSRCKYWKGIVAEIF